jgi:hypothetical protein
MIFGMQPYFRRNVEDDLNTFLDKLKCYVNGRENHATSRCLAQLLMDLHPVGFVMLLWTGFYQALTFVQHGPIPSSRT